MKEERGGGIWGAWNEAALTAARRIYSAYEPVLPNGTQPGWLCIIYRDIYQVTNRRKRHDDDTTHDDTSHQLAALPLGNRARDEKANKNARI